MEMIFNNVGKQLKCSGNTNLGHDVQSNSVSLMSNSRLQLMNKCSKCGVVCTKIRRRQNDFLKNNENSFSQFFYVEYDEKDSKFNKILYF